MDLDVDADPPKILVIGPASSGPDADIDALADEVAGEFDVEVLKTRRRGRPRLDGGPAEVVPVRLDSTLRNAIEARATNDHTTTSEVIREALRKYLNVA